jgi:hypothetical protein
MQKLPVVGQLAGGAGQTQAPLGNAFVQTRPVAQKAVEPWMQLLTVEQVTSRPLASQYFPACPAWHSGGSAGQAQAADGELPPQV